MHWVQWEHQRRTISPSREASEKEDILDMIPDLTLIGGVRYRQTKMGGETRQRKWMKPYTEASNSTVCTRLFKKSIIVEHEKEGRRERWTWGGEQTSDAWEIPHAFGKSLMLNCSQWTDISPIKLISCKFSQVLISWKCSQACRWNKQLGQRSDSGLSSSRACLLDHYSINDPTRVGGYFHIFC